MKKTLYWFIIHLRRTNPIMRVLIEHLAFLYYSIFRKGRTFTFQGRKYNYFYHLYNRTVGSERIIEIPIAKRILDEYKGKNVLEVGNVLSHYFPTTHDIIDKYEKAEGVINEDVVSFKSDKKYDLILSVSTLEHVGYSYGEPWVPKKFDKAIRNLKKHLRKEGMFFATFPLFLNPRITELIKDDKMPFSKEYFMKRTSFLNEWKQVSRKEALVEEKYDGYYANANLLYIGIFKK